MISKIKIVFNLFFYFILKKYSESNEEDIFKKEDRNLFYVKVKS